MDSVPSLSGGEGDSTALIGGRELSGLSIVRSVCHWRRSRRGAQGSGESFCNNQLCWSRFACDYKPCFKTRVHR